MARSLVRISPIALLSLLAACSGGGSGGGGGGGTPAPTPPPAATAGISSDLATVVVNQAAKISWTSANAASCAASGDWSNAIGTSGSLDLAFASAGTKTLTITCGSATASATVNVVAVTSYSVPVDLSAVTYPASYTTPIARAIDLDNDPCGTGLTVVTYPQADIGRYPLPAIAGAPFASAVERGVGMKDVWEPANASYVNGCSASARSELTRTIERIKALGGDYLTLNPWTFIGTSTAGDWHILNPGDLAGSSTMNDADLTWAVGEAHRLGLKVHWVNQIQGLQDGATISVPAATRANASKFLAAYEPYMIERAGFLQSIGVDAMMVSCQCFTVLEDAAFADLYEAGMASLLPQVRARFKGKIRFYGHPSIMTNATIRNNIDLVGMGLWLNVTAAEVPTLTAAILKSKFADTLASLDTVYHGLAKPVIFEIGVPSRADYYTTGYLEETFCTSGFNVITGSADACIQQSMTPDLSLQAVYYEGYLEAVKAQSLFTIGAVESAGYWMVDGTRPSNAFPNLAFSIRNKPAEGIVKAWFAR